MWRALKRAFNSFSSSKMAKKLLPALPLYPYLVSLIDLNFNSAFSFGAKSFSCNPKGKNALAMFTTAGDLYLMHSAAFSALGVKANGAYTLTVSKANDKVKNSTDLANYFGIKM